jgi:hypothetical protein
MTTSNASNHNGVELKKVHSVIIEKSDEDDEEEEVNQIFDLDDLLV